MKNKLLCCDWGTTSFRLRLMEIQSHKMMGEVLSPEGISQTFDAWKRLGNTGVSKQLYFTLQLAKHIDTLGGQLNIELKGIPVVLSGMASSSIGMVELAYAELPFGADGQQANTFRIEATEDFLHDIVVISGVRSDKDVMRGEETQWIGLMSYLNLEAKDPIFIFPGTHSKHLYVESNKMVDFQTYMTGELFGAISQHTILKDSVEVVADRKLSDDKLKAFRYGVSQSLDSGILRGLFSVRTNQLFNKLNKQENSLYLSGLLIGSELRHLLGEPKKQLMLCSGQNLSVLYNIAMEELGLLDRTIVVPADLVNTATIAGQIKIFQNQAIVLNNINL